MLENLDNIFWLDESDVLANLESTDYSFQVAPGAPELLATMVYRDPAGTTSSSLHRINDLDLRAVSPSGVVYNGNHGLDAGNYSAPGGSPNTVDTVENIYVENPEAGSWQITVFASEVNQDAHIETGAVDADYALIVRGVDLSTPTPPLAPSELDGTASATRAFLRWTDNADNEDDFEVEREEGGIWSVIATLPADSEGYIDTGLVSGSDYRYRVRAGNAQGASPDSNIISLTAGPKGKSGATQFP